MKTASKPAIATIRQTKEAGFTLMELIITVIIVGVLASLAIPSFRGFIADQRVKTATFDTMAALMLARSEAIKRNTASALNFTTGNAWRLNVGTTVLLNQEMPAGINISIGPTAGTPPCYAIAYEANGRTLGNKSCFINISSSSSTLTRCIRLDLSGRPNVKNDAC